MLPAKPKEKPLDKRERVTGRLRHALDLMIWGDENGAPMEWNDAARAVNISARSMRKSLERPSVRRYLQEQKQVLRSCISAKSLRRLDELAAQRSNMNAAVNAIRAIDEGEPRPDALHPSNLPGITIKIIPPPTPAPASSIIDVTPTPVPPNRAIS